MQRLDVRAGTEEWRFLYYLLLGDSRDESGLIIPHAACAELELGEPPTEFILEHIYVARHFLERMQARFPELAITWLEAATLQRKARTLQATVPTDIAARLNEELAVLLPEAQRVYFLDGGLITRNKKAQERAKAREAVIQENGEWLTMVNPGQQLMFNYLNDLPSHQFTKTVSSNLNSAKAAIALLPAEKQERELNLLELIEAQPQPFYSFSRRSTRLTLVGSTIASLKTPIRKALTAGWVEMDLKNAQLAINAMVWDLPTTQTFLQTGRSWWEALFEWYGIEPDPEIKQQFKNATYALCYGASKKTITEGEDGELGLGNYTGRFFEHPIVREIWLARRKILREITSTGGYPDAYGNSIEVDPARKVNTRSVLAQVSQSYEQMLIAEIFKLAYPNNKYHAAFKVVLYQFDGVSVSFTDAERKALWLGRIQSAVKCKAQELGIHTELTF